jgi:large subunit ribosomal protein L10
VPKQEKVDTVEKIKEKLSLAKISILTEFQGLNVAEMTELRKLFRAADVDYKVYKNTLTRLAAHQLGVRGIDEYLVGTTALAFSKDDLVAPAKIIKDFSANHRNLRVKVGILDRKLISSDDVIALATTPPREVLLAMVLGGIQNPISRLLGVLQGPVRDLACVLKNLAEQMDKGQGTADQQAKVD